MPRMQILATHPTRSLLAMLCSHPRQLTIAVIAHLAKDSPLWLVPVFTAGIIDTVVVGTDFARLWLLVGLTALSLSINYPLHILYVREYSNVYRTVAAELRNMLTARLQTLSIGFLNRKSAAVIQTKIVRDVENIELMFQQVMPVLLVATSILVGSVVVTAVQVPAFLLVYLLTVPLSVALIGVMRRHASARNQAFRLTMETLSAEVGDMTTLIPITRAHGVEETATLTIAASTETVRAAGLKLDRLNSRFETSSWVSFNLLAALCLGAAAWASMSHVIPVTAGQVVLLSTYFASLTGAITQLVGLTPILSKGIESVKSIAEVLDDPDVEQNHDKVTVDSIAGRVVFEHVGYAFPEAASLAVDDLNLVAAEGTMTALVGASGSGKSTTINLVLGFVRPTSGRILLDGLDMQTLDLRSVRKFVSVVPQEPLLFEGSIYDNITYGLDRPTEEHARQALIDANAAEFVDALDGGWRSLVGQRGAQLSGGQRQRLAIARALIRNPRILVLDEATSALDGDSEAKVKQALERLMRGRTTLVVAHRLSTIRNADQIVVMDHGRIVERGDHDSLLEAGGQYARLFGAQPV